MNDEEMKKYQHQLINIETKRKGALKTKKAAKAFTEKMVDLLIQLPLEIVEPEEFWATMNGAISFTGYKKGYKIRI